MPDINEINARVTAEFHANQGRVTTMGGSEILLLTTTGAKTGQQRTTPLVYTRDGGRIIIIGSKGGGPVHPAWFINLRANPRVTVEVGTERFEAKATPAEGAERERLYNQQAEQVPIFKEYEKKTTRQIPVVVIERIEG